jgi:hypothetical protein
MKTKKKCVLKKIKTNKNKQKGGSSFIDYNFLECYEKNLAKIQMAISNYSGKHSIDNIIANEFIESQTSAIRREAAKNLIDNTIYITIEEVFDIVGKLVERLYSELNGYDTIYLYSGEPKKSFYFLSVISLFHIRAKNYKEPIFVKELNEELFEITGDKSPIIMLDDVSYSGAQLSSMLSSIYVNQTYKKKKNPPNIYVALVALNDNSKYKITHVPSSAAKFAKLKDSPFKLIYLEDRLYKPIVSIIGIEKYIYMNLIFSPWTLSDGQPSVSIYLDHKIADAGSTYTTTLLYGQIAPPFIDFNTYMHDLWLPYHIIQVNDPAEKIRLFNELDDKYKDKERILFNKIINHFILQDVPDKENNVISFKPFINHCNKNSKLLENINNPEITNLDYLIFMIPEFCINKKKDCVVSMENIHTYLLAKQYMESSPNSSETFVLTESGERILSIHQKITNYKCPISWYKNGDLAMNCSLMNGGKNGKTKKKSKKVRKSRINRK